MEWIYQAPILFFSVVFHEFAHGYAAHLSGDDTAYHSGRLTLNPLPHIDFFGTILLPVICYAANLPLFGWAKPVPVNPLRFYNFRRDMLKVAASGPASNLLLVLIAAGLISLSRFVVGSSFSLLLAKALTFAVTVNLVLAFFNLIPVAPLDGSKVLGALLPRNLAISYEKHTPYGMWILLGLMATGLIKYLIVPPLMVSLYLLAKAGLPLL